MTGAGLLATASVPLIAGMLASCLTVAPHRVAFCCSMARNKAAACTNRLSICPDVLEQMVSRGAATRLIDPQVFKAFVVAFAAAWNHYYASDTGRRDCGDGGSGAGPQRRARRDRRSRCGSWFVLSFGQGGCGEGKPPRIDAASDQLLRIAEAATVLICYSLDENVRTPGCVRIPPSAPETDINQLDELPSSHFPLFLPH